ncbi:amidohydrolase family protein [Streptomyces sp. NPDC046985]|uniref:amidohydrolase family protein n=1 Tax=Streptomyces sp. NPDC046985 TaxID=3155377 RepID=UPI0034058A8A
MPSGRIDIHHHLIPSWYREAFERHGKSAGGWPTPDWSRASSLALMDELAIETALLSASAPGVNFGDRAEARSMARRVNEYAAEMVKDKPDRYGLFAVLPLPDMDGALAEVAFALDELGADGVGILSNIDGRYLGDPEFEPLWQELDRRGAVVFIHPEAPPMPMLKELPSPLLDFPFETTRTAVHMVTHGVMKRYTNVTVILAHAGGFIPFASERFAIAGRFSPDVTEEDMRTGMKRFYLDLALSSSPTSMPSLLSYADPTHLVYGSDFPFAPSQEFADMLDAYPLDTDQRAAVRRGNAERILPRLQSA